MGITFYRKILNILRFPESFLMTGFFMIGGIFAIENFNFENLFRLILSFLVCLFLVFSIYEYNAFAGYSYDKYNERLRKISFFKSSHFFYLYLLFFLLSITTSLFLNYYLWLFIIITQVLWFLYSHPNHGFKIVPYAGSILHFIAQIVHFNMIWMVFKPIAYSSLLISAFFALIFSAGHIHHELIDYESDMEQNIRTGASKMGYKTAARVSYLIFLLAHFYLVFLWKIKLFETSLLLLFWAGFLIQTVLFFIFKPFIMKPTENRIKYRDLYRAIFFIEGLLIILLK